MDEDGNFVPTAGNKVRFSIEGDAEIFGADNGNPVSHEPMKGTEISAFNGKCLVVIKAVEKPGNVRLIASADGLNLAKAEVKLN